MQPRAMRRAWRQDERFRANKRRQVGDTTWDSNEPPSQEDSMERTIPKPPLTMKMRKKGTYDVSIGGKTIGMVTGTYDTGFIAYGGDGKRVGKYTGPRSKEQAAEATRTAHELSHITSALGGTILQIDVNDVTEHVGAA